MWTQFCHRGIIHFSLYYISLPPKDHFKQLNPEIFRLLRKRDLSYSRAKALNSTAAWAKFRSLRNRAVASVRGLSSRISTKSGKQFWSLYHSLSSSKQRIPQLISNGSISIDSGGTCSTHPVSPPLRYTRDSLVTLDSISCTSPLTR